MTQTEFYNDRDIAQRMKFSVSWVRVQRYLRKHGLPHVFKVDPCYIGSSPRYVVEVVDAFLKSIADQGAPQ